MDLHVLFFNSYEGSLYYGYINALFFSKKYGGAVITHQEYIDADFVYDENFVGVLDLEKVTESDKEKIMQFGIPRDFFENLEKQYASKTQALLHLLRERDDTLEEYLCTALNACGEQINRIYVYGETYESVKFLATERNITIINFEYSTVRRGFGYTCNLMWEFTRGNLHYHREMLDRYTNFCDEIDKNILLKREELIALFVPTRQIMLIPLIDEKPAFEIGILNTGFGVIPVYCKDIVCTDDDVYYLCKKYYKQDEIIQRKHPSVLSAEDLEYGFYERDTVSFILSCKRIASVSSNGLFEAMLWGRTSCIALDAMGFYFMSEHDFSSEKIVDETFLNFYLIAALVPSPRLLFDPHYWEMRAKMSEVDLYHYHLNYILDLLGIDKQILDMPVPKRLDAIIESRGVDPSVVSKPKFQYDSPFYSNLRSELCVHSNGREKIIECVNYQVGGEVISSFNINEAVDYAEFYPHREKTGFIEIRKILIDGEEIWEKNDGLKFVLQQYKKEIAPLPVQSIGTLQVVWKSENNSIYNVKQISEQSSKQSEQNKILNTEISKLSTEINELNTEIGKRNVEINELNTEIGKRNAEINELNTEISNIYNSRSWRITKPLRVIGGCLNWKK